MPQSLPLSKDAPWALSEADPHPMWDFDLETLALLQVDEAAVRRYGYSHEEFSGQTIEDLRDPKGSPPCTNALAAYPGRPRRRRVGGTGRGTARTSTWRSSATTSCTRDVSPC